MRRIKHIHIQTYKDTVLFKVCHFRQQRNTQRHWHTPANCINVLRVGLFLRLTQTIPESDETLSEALVDGATWDWNGSSETQRQEICGEEEQLPLAPPSFHHRGITEVWNDCVPPGISSDGVKDNVYTWTRPIWDGSEMDQTNTEICCVLLIWRDYESSQPNLQDYQTM